MFLPVGMFESFVMLAVAASASGMSNIDLIERVNIFREQVNSIMTYTDKSEVTHIIMVMRGLINEHILLFLTFPLRSGAMTYFLIVMTLVRKY